MALSTRPEKRKLFQTLSREPCLLDPGRVFLEFPNGEQESWAWPLNECCFEPPSIQIYGTATDEEMVRYEPDGAVTTYTYALLIAEELGEQDIWFGTPVEQAIVDQLNRSVRKVPAVEIVCIKGERDFYKVWTILDKREDSIDEAIYAAEVEVMDALQNAQLDFTILHRMGKPLSEILPHGATIIYRRT
jgi:hypothetical protein